jgi:hypothetical protein
MLFAHRREVLPAELAGSAGKLAHDNRFRLLRQGRVWCPPALVLWAAARLGYTWGDAAVVTVAALNAGWHGVGRPWRILKAHVVLLWACRLHRRRGFIYEDRELLVFSGDAPPGRRPNRS